MKEKFEALLDKKDKTLHEKMLIVAIRMIAHREERRNNAVYCQIEKEIEMFEKMDGE